MATADTMPSANASATVTIACLGDITPGDSLLPGNRRDAGEASARLAAPLAGTELVLANLETVVTTALHPRTPKRYTFRCNPDLLDLFDHRFVLGLANNHTMDFGEAGLLDTLHALEERGIPHAGAGRNLDAARRPALIDLPGARIAMICAADPRFQAATPDRAGTCPAHPALLRETIREARQQADVVIVSIHAGTEYLPVPSPAQLALADLCFEEAVRVVSFHHAHRLSGLQRRDQGVALHGTGKYMAVHKIPSLFTAWRESAVWRVTLRMPESDVTDVAMHPLLLETDGLPVPAAGARAQGILRKVDRYTRRIESGNLWGWRLTSMLHPSYVLINMQAYTDMLKRRGIGATCRALAGGLRALFARPQAERRPE